MGRIAEMRREEKNRKEKNKRKEGEEDSIITD